MAADVCACYVSRRRFVQGAGLAGLGLLAGCGRLPGQAPPAQKVPRIGYLSGGPRTDTLASLDAFVQGLVALGYVNGQNIAIESRFAEGQAEQFDALAAELVALPVDVLVVGGSRSVQAAKQATSTIPIVIAETGDPVDRGFVASLARPGGNVTGLSALLAQLSGKRLQLVLDVVSGGARIAVLGDAGSASISARFDELQAAGQLLGVQVQSLDVREPREFERAFAAAVRESAAAMIVLNNGFTLVHRAELVRLAARSRLPAMYETSQWTKAGGLMAYGANVATMHHRAAYYVDRILKGAKPADLPIEQPTTFDFVINLQTADALGLTIPQHVLLQATEIIQ